MIRPGSRSSLVPSCLLLAVVLLGSGCASIVHSGNRTVTINTDPSGATATITKLDGAEVISTGVTPCTVSLDPKRGYFKGQSYRLKLDLAGHQSSEIIIQPKMSGWYLGNIVFGGLIGMLAVDPVTGSMWNLEPEKIEQKLMPSQMAAIKSGEGFVVVLTSQLTENERRNLVRVQ